MSKKATKQRRFVVVGSGGIAQWLLEGLCRIALHKDYGIVIVDGDHFEPKNIDRQNFYELGNKAEVRALELTERFPALTILPIPKWVVEAVEAIPADEFDPEYFIDDKILPTDLMEEGDVVFAVVDNHATRKLIFDAAKHYKDIDVFTGGNNETYEGSVYWYRRRNGQELIDHPAMYHEELVNPADRNPGELSCIERAMLDGGHQTIAANMAVATLLITLTGTVIVDDQKLNWTGANFDLAFGTAVPFDRTAEEMEEVKPARKAKKTRSKVPT